MTNKINLNISEIPEVENSKKRLIGLDILKILSMFFIIIYHVSLHGGFYNNSTGFSHFILSILNALFLPSVNIFVFVSSYLIIKKGRVSIKRYMNLWAQIVFYTVLTYFIACICSMKSLTIIDFIKCFFPVTFSFFWFCREYLILYIISPLLLKLVQSLNKKEYTILFIAIIGLCFWCTLVRDFSILFLHNGFSVIWFVLLFLLAGYQHRFGIDLQKKIFGIVFILLSVLAYLTVVKSRLSVNYANIIIVIQTLSLFNLMYDINIKNRFMTKCLGYISTCTLGIYLVHDGAFSQSYLYRIIFKTYQHFDNNLLLWFFIFVAIIFIVGLIIETFRKLTIMFFKRVVYTKDL